MRETKIIQVYPSDYAIERAIKEWESFGWEMTSNQKFSDKQDLWSPVGTTVRTTTYNKLTFSREKSSPWYSEVKQLEQEYEEVKSEISLINLTKPQKKGFGVLDAITIWLPIPFISCILYQIIKKARYKKALKRFEANSTEELEELNSKAESIKRDAQRIVNAAN